MTAVPQVDPRDVPAGATIIDVREDYEWEGGHATGAKHITLSTLADRLAEQDPLDAVELGVGQGGGACGTRHGARLRPTAAPRLPTVRGPASAPGAGRVSSRGGTGAETGTAAPTAPTGPEPPFLMRRARSDLRT